MSGRARSQPANKRMDRLEQWGRVAQIAQGTATAVALLAGAWWFIEQRQTFPHAKVEQAVDIVPVAKGLISVEAQVRFENTGKLMIRLTHATVKLQNVAADPYGYAVLAEDNGPSYWTATRPISTPDPRQFNEGELRWPLLKQFDGPIDHVVEPGETDVLVFTFLLPCRPDKNAAELRMVRVASDIHKPAEGTIDFAWKARAFADVSEACNEKAPQKLDR